MGPDAMILVFFFFLTVSLKPAVSLFSFTLKRLFSFSLLSKIRVDYIYNWQESIFAYRGVYLFIQKALKMKKQTNKNFLLKYKNGPVVEIT